MSTSTCIVITTLIIVVGFTITICVLVFGRVNGSISITHKELTLKGRIFQTEKRQQKKSENTDT